METVGLVEDIKLIGEETITAKALFDTGARRTSVDIKLAKKAGLGPVIKTARVRVASMKERSERPVVLAIIEINGKKFETEVNLQDRSHMNFPVIIGRNILAGHFLVDCKKNLDIFKRRAKSRD